MKYVIIGSALTGNKGAASMLEASIQTITARDSEAEFTLLSMYPDADRELNQYSNLKIIDGRPKTLGPITNSLSLMYKLLPPVRPLLRRNDQVRALAEGDVLLDQGGVTFVDGREKFLIYNIASILPSLFIGQPVVKCAQALGSFKNPINRNLAKVFLPKVNTIFCRGEKTFEYVQGVSSSNSQLAADYAFSLTVTSESQEVGDASFKDQRVDSASIHLGVFPSQVLRDKVDNYDKIMAETIDLLTTRYPDLAVYILPHSQREDPTKLHNNDNNVCEEVYSLVNDKSSARLCTDYLSPQEMRAFISNLDFTVAARFHAMVSSLSTGIPTLVTTWSHKYAEVLDMFDCGECAFVGDALTAEALANSTGELLEARDVLKQRISAHLPAVKESSLRQADEIVRIAAS